jgi:uncharacterized membrane protein YbhN (UPF0104 family)
MQIVAGSGLNARRGLVAYLAGGPMIFTPARAGEVVRSAYVRQLLQVPVAKTVPILIAERLADIGVMAAIASAGLLLVGRLDGNWPPLVGALALLVMMLAALLVLGRMGPRIWDRWGPSSTAIASAASAARRSGRALLGPRPLVINAGLGLAAWAVEVAIYALAVKAIGGSPTSPLCLTAMAVFPLASLIGALSLVPGGLGATEGSLAALGTSLAGLTLEASLAGGILARAAILLVVIVTGLPALAIVIALSRRRGSSPATVGPT